MKNFIFAAALALSSSLTTTPDVATQKLVQASKLFHDNDWIAATKLDMEVLKMKGLPDDMRSAAFLLMGNIGLSQGRLDVAEIAYNDVLLLKGAPKQDKESARSGLELVIDLRRDAERNEQDPQIYK